MSTALRTYYRGDELVGLRDGQANATRYYHFDHQGTTQCLTDKSGAVTDRFASDAWGVEVKRTGNSINRHWYVGNWGYYRLLVSEYNVRDRWLQALISRWQSRDPKPHYTGANLFSYVSNCPASFADPSGDWQQRNDLLGLARSITPGKLTQCGGAMSVILMVITGRPPGAPPARGYDGWIIQHVKLFVKKYDCSGRQAVPICNPFLDYWEAWQVVDNIPHLAITPPGRTSNAVNDDVFTVSDECSCRNWTIFDPHRCGCSQGEISKIGRISFFLGYPFTPTGWQRGYPEHAPYNWVRFSPPPGIPSLDSGIAHELHVHWRCCDPNYDEPDVTGIP